MAKQIVTGENSRRRFAWCEHSCRRSEDYARPKGRNAVIEKKFGAPIITKDGVTVAKESNSAIPSEHGRADGPRSRFQDFRRCR